MNYSTLTSDSNELLNDEEILCYPNPSSGTIWIKLNQSTDSKVMIYSISGKLMYSKELYQNLSELDLSGLHDGIYVFQIYNDGRIYNRKVVLK